jgi:hypothetical protein
MVAFNNSLKRAFASCTCHEAKFSPPSDSDNDSTD